MIVQLLVTFLLIQFSLGEPKQLACKSLKSKICQLDSFDIHVSLFPDLSSKHTLVIKSGSVANFSKDLSSKLGSITKIQLGKLGIRSLYISPTWVSLNAENNQIRELKVEEHNTEDVSCKPFNDDLRAIDDAAKRAKYPSHSSEVEDTGDLENHKNMLRFLNLINNHLESVDQLRYFCKLEEAFLDGNQIEYIDMKTFHNMQNLTKLSLNNNKISRISAHELTHLPALEKLSLTFNQLTKLEVRNWTMLHLTDLDISNNKLTKIDEHLSEHFVSLEKVALSNNSWNCNWIIDAFNNIHRNFVQLVDSDETCIKDHIKYKALCCSYDDPDENEITDVYDRIERINDENKSLKDNMNDKLDKYESMWNKDLESLKQQVKDRLKPYETMGDQMNRYQNNDIDSAVNELNKQLKDCDELIEKLESFNEENKKIAQTFKDLFYATLAEKNKLNNGMLILTKLEQDMNNYELSFD